MCHLACQLVNDNTRSRDCMYVTASLTQPGGMCCVVICMFCVNLVITHILMLHVCCRGLIQDGDMFLVLWDDELLQPSNSEPGEYGSVRPRKVSSGILPSWPLQHLVSSGKYEPIAVD